MLRWIKFFFVMSLPKRLVTRVLAMAGYGLVKQDELDKLAAMPPPLKLYLALPKDKQELIAPYLGFSKSQLAQDLFVLSETLGADCSPYFVEFGATDGVLLSNTHLLETQLGWAGILAEPAKTWHDKLRQNRSCTIDLRCVAATSGQQLGFVEHGEISSLTDYANSGDWASQARMESTIRYNVETISLVDLLAIHGAPAKMAYLSIDTEGSELAILEAFDFSRYSFKVITVEHNYTPARQAIHDLLTAHGYERKLTELSAFDDWYVLRD